MTCVEMTFYSEDGKSEEHKLILREWEKHPWTAIKQIFRYPRGVFYFFLHRCRIMPFREGNKTDELINSILGFKPAMVCITYEGERYMFKLGSLGCGVGPLMEIIVYNQYDISPAIVKGKVGIDVGANIGAFSIMAAKMGAKKVYAFEPVKETYELLKENIRLNKLGSIIKPYNCAVSNETEKTVTIYYKFAGDMAASLHPHFKPGKKKKQKVKVSRLDDVGKSVDFIKIDAEGSERAILIGAQRLLAKHKPHLMLSAYHRKNDKTELPKAIYQGCKDYSCKVIKRDNEETLICQVAAGVKKSE